ncbi:MAG: hypothetical protein D6720_12955 [Gammaproteobacteria bacterium]|nr:MAG: hypothetical protein D6720_12955 [Gammaproteobacteria bacterium]
MLPRSQRRQITTPCLDADFAIYARVLGATYKDARYEAERASIPVVLMDLDNVATEIQRHYDEMDMEAKRLIPLTKIYWPA